MEFFELMDAEGNKIGQLKERTQVHRDGDLHGSSHVWVVGPRREDGEFPILLQKRSRKKDSFPGCLDVACAGHVSQGETFLSTAIREMREELGLSVSEADVWFLFKMLTFGDYRFHDMPFINREVTFVYLLRSDYPLTDMHPQAEEIEDLLWVNSGELEKELLAGNDTYCIDYWEFEELKRFL